MNMRTFKRVANFAILAFALALVLGLFDFTADASTSTFIIRRGLSGTVSMPSPDTATLWQGTRYDVNVHIGADVSNYRHTNIYVRAGSDPLSGIVVATLGTNRTSRNIWESWTPTTNGTFTIFAVIYNTALRDDQSIVAYKTVTVINEPVTQHTITLNRSPTAGGAVSGAGTFNAGTSRTVTATVNSGYAFDGWYEGSSRVSTNLSYTFTLNRNITLEARFNLGSATITLNRNPAAGGAVSGAGTFNIGTSRTVTATVNSGYTFDGWYEGSSRISTNLSFTFTLNSNRTLEARFNVVTPTYTITLSRNPTAGGTVSGAGTFNSGTSRTVTATVNSGYTFDGWYEGNSRVSTSLSYTFTLNRDIRLEARWMVDTPPPLTPSTLNANGVWDGMTVPANRDFAVGGTFATGEGAHSLYLRLRRTSPNESTPRINTPVNWGVSSWDYIIPADQLTPGEYNLNIRVARSAVEQHCENWDCANHRDTTIRIIVEEAHNHNAALQAAIDRANRLRAYRFTPQNDISQKRSDGTIRTYRAGVTYQGFPYSMGRELTPHWDLTYQNGRPTTYQGFDCSQYVGYILGIGTGVTTARIRQIADDSNDSRLYFVNNIGDIRVGDIFNYGPAGAAAHVVFITAVYEENGIWQVEYIDQRGAIVTDIETGLQGSTVKFKRTLQNAWNLYGPPRTQGSHIRASAFYGQPGALRMAAHAGDIASVSFDGIEVLSDVLEEQSFTINFDPILLSEVNVRISDASNIYMNIGNGIIKITFLPLSTYFSIEATVTVNPDVPAHTQIPIALFNNFDESQTIEGIINVLDVSDCIFCYDVGCYVCDVSCDECGKCANCYGSPPTISRLTFAADSVSARPGTSILVPIRITDNSGLAGAEITITLGAGLEWDYNPSIYDNRPAFSATWPYIAGGSVRLTGRPSMMGLSANFAFLNFDGEQMESFDCTGDGILLTLKLKVSESVAVGDVLTVGVTVRACGSTAKAYTTDEYTAVNGTIVIINVLYGDVDGNGTVDVNDVLALIRWYNDRSVEINMANADLDASGTVDVNDVLLLIRWYNDRSVILGPR
jgi:uncharacterized repeat protein (TIGR02543 family)